MGDDAGKKAGRKAGKRAKKAAPRPTRPRIPLGLLVRMFAIGALSVAAAAYGLYRHYAVPRARMLVPAEPPASSEAELPAPELEPAPSPPLAPAAPAASAASPAPAAPAER